MLNKVKHATAVYFQLTREDSVYKDAIFKILDDLPNYDSEEVAIYLVEHMIKATLLVHMPKTCNQHFESYKINATKYEDAIEYLNKIFRCVESITEKDYPTIKYED